MPDTTIAERVAAGAAFLDEHDPGWDTRINLSHLDLETECRCILGQLGADLADSETGENYNEDWLWLCRHFGVSPFGREAGRPTDEDLGFNARVREGRRGSREEYEALTAEWRRLIEQRRAAS